MLNCEWSKCVFFTVFIQYCCIVTMEASQMFISGLVRPTLYVNRSVFVGPEQKVTSC